MPAPKHSGKDPTNWGRLFYRNTSIGVGQFSIEQFKAAGRSLFYLHGFCCECGQHLEKSEAIPIYDPRVADIRQSKLVVMCRECSGDLQC